MQHTLRLSLFILPFTAVSQQRVLFADSLEERSEVNVIKNPVEYTSNHRVLSFTKMKMAERSLKNFEIHSEYFDDPGTVTQNQKIKVPLYLLRFVLDGTIIGDPIHTNAKYSVSDHFSYQLAGPASHEVHVSGIRSAIESYSGIDLHKVRVSNVKPDTSYLTAQLISNGSKSACTLEAFFMGDRPASIAGIALIEGDTIFIRTTNQAKKYRALGVELRLHDRVIGGLQLPDMHIGPSYSIVDKELPDDLKNMVYAILSVLLFTNENRIRDL